MAKNRKHLVESDSDGSQELTHSSKKPLAAMKKPRLVAASKAAPAPTSSESGSESDSDPKGSPIPTQPTNGSRPKSSAADLVTPTKKRRAAEEKDADDAKKKKKKGEPETSNTPKKSNRVWSEHDEIVIIQGLLDYWVEKKADPAADGNAFLGFIKNKLQKKDVVKQKLQEKVRKLKIKYEKKKKEGDKDGKEISFLNPHEKTLYELSKSVWGNKATDKEEEAAEEDEAETEHANGVKLTVEEEEMVENGEKGWKELCLEEMKLHLRLLELKTAMARLDFERFMSEGK